MVSCARYLLFIYEIFNDAAKHSDIIASNSKMVREKWVETVWMENAIA